MNIATQVYCALAGVMAPMVDMAKTLIEALS